jgi:hypothetical protein
VSITSVCRFVSHAGAEVSVRTSRDLNTDRLMIEPHGTLQRQGGVFMLTPEGASVPRTYRRTRVVHAPSVPVVVRRPAPARARPRKRDGAPAGIEVGEAIETLARFVRGDRDVPLTAARRAHAAIGQFLGLPQRRS